MDLWFLEAGVAAGAVAGVTGPNDVWERPFTPARMAAGQLFLRFRNRRARILSRTAAARGVPRLMSAGR
jgi:hypothetical protein